MIEEKTTVVRVPNTILKEVAVLKDKLNVPWGAALGEYIARKEMEVIILNHHNKVLHKALRDHGVDKIDRVLFKKLTKEIRDEGLRKFWEKSRR